MLLDVGCLLAAVYESIPSMTQSLGYGVNSGVRQIRRATSTKIPDLSKTAEAQGPGCHVFVLLVLNNILPPLSSIVLCLMKILPWFGLGVDMGESIIGYDSPVTFVLASNFPYLPI